MRVPILMYHWFDDGRPTAGPEFGIAPAEFRRQMLWLRDQGYASLTVGELAAALASGGPLPRRPVVVTFDDAYVDFHERAMPVLEEAGVKATLYVVSGLVGRTNRWDQAAGEPERPLLGWPELRELSAAGVEIGAHSVSHPDMRTLDDRALGDELARSRKELEDGVGVSIGTFAYPFGFQDERVRRAARSSGYTAACAVALGPLDLLRSDRYRLMRAIVHADKSFSNFKLRVRLAAPRHGWDA